MLKNAGATRSRVTNPYAKAGSDFDTALAAANDIRALDDLRVRYFGRKGGLIPALFAQLKDVPKEQGAAEEPGSSAGTVSLFVTSHFDDVQVQALSAPRATASFSTSSRPFARDIPTGSP